MAEKHFNEKDWKKLADDEKLNGQILEKVQDTCKDNAVEDFETPRRIKIVTDSWTPDSGLVNDALKLKRKAIEEKYKDDIEQLYEDEPKEESTTKRRTTTRKDE